MPVMRKRLGWVLSSNPASNDAAIVQAWGCGKSCAALVSGGEVEAGGSTMDPVTPSAFLEATQQLLQQATAYQDELKLVAAKRSAVLHH